MKQLLFLTILISLADITIAQVPCKQYRSIMKAAEKAQAEKDYKTAILKYSEAKVCAPRQATQLDQKMASIVSTIAYHKAQAEKKAEQATIRAEIAEKVAERSKEHKQIALQMARSQTNNALALNLEKSSPDLAQAISYYNYQQYPEQTSTASVFHRLSSKTELFKQHTFKVSPQPIQDFIYFPDHHILLADNFEQATLYDTTGFIIQRFKGHAHEITALAHHSNTGTILTGSRDRTAKLWNMQGEVQQTFRGHTAALTSVDISPDGQHILTGSEDGTAKLWDLEGKMLRAFSSHKRGVTAVTFLPDGLRVLTADEFGNTSLWNINGTRIRSLKKHRKAVNSIHCSNGGKYVLTTSRDSMAILNNLEDRGVYHLIGHQGKVTTAAFSKDGQYIITGATDNKIKIWDWQGRNIQTLEAHDTPVSGVQCIPNGGLIWSASTNKELKAWRTIPAFFQENTTRFSLSELVLVGMQIQEADLALVEDEKILKSLLNLFYAKKNWEMVINTYLKLSDEQQKNKRSILKFYDAKKQLGIEELESLADFDNMKYWSVFAPYFARQGDTSTAFSYYDKIISSNIEKNRIKSHILLDWYALHPSKDIAFDTLLTYHSPPWFRSFSIYFHKQKDWEKVRFFTQKILEMDRGLSAQQRWIWYEAEQALGRDSIEILLASEHLNDQKYFAKQLRKQEDWEAVLPFYEKIAAQVPTTQNLLSWYEVQQRLGKDIYESLINKKYVDNWLGFAHYFEQKKEWEKAQTLYQQLLEKEDKPEYCDRLYRVNKQLELMSFRDLFLPNDIPALKQNYRYFNKKAKQQLVGHRKEAYEKAVRVSEHLLILQESRSNRQRLATFYNWLAWDRLYAQDFLGSLTYIKREQDTKAKVSLHHRIMPATLLFLNDFDRAKKLYRKWKNKKLPLGSPYPRLRDAYLADIEDFEKRGMVHPNLVNAVEEVKALLRK